MQTATRHVKTQSHSLLLLHMRYASSNLRRFGHDSVAVYKDPHTVGPVVHRHHRPITYNINLKTDNTSEQCSFGELRGLTVKSGLSFWTASLASSPVYNCKFNQCHSLTSNTVPSQRGLATAAALPFCKSRVANPVYSILYTYDARSCDSEGK